MVSIGVPGGRRGAAEYAREMCEMSPQTADQDSYD